MSGWDNLSPDVEAVLKSGDRRQQDRHLTPAQKRERARQADRVRATYDVPDWLKAEIRRVADVEYVSASSLVSYLIAVGLRDLARGKIRLRKTGSDSPRFDFIVKVTEHDAGL